MITKRIAKESSSRDEPAVVSQVDVPGDVEEGEVIIDDTELILDSDPVEEYLYDENIIEIE